MPYLKPFIFSFLCFSSLTASTAPSFTFSEKEGLKPLIEQDLKIEKKKLEIRHELSLNYKKAVLKATKKSDKKKNFLKILLNRKPL